MESKALKDIVQCLTFPPLKCLANIQMLREKTLTNFPGNGVAAFYLLAANDVPDAGHPVGEQSEHRHEQGQHHGAVLGVAVQLLQQAQQA